MIEQSQLDAFGVHADVLDVLNQLCTKYDISTPRRVRYFMSQSCFESNFYSSMQENLNYTHADRLVAVWPSRFTLDQANTHLAYAPDYINNPEKLANLVYANRNGNGDPASGDGWAFRGQGAFGLTGRSNYANYSQAEYGDDRIIQTPSLVSQIPDALFSAGWFWNLHGMNAMADADEFTKVTSIINGSAATVPQRTVLLNKANTVF